MDQLQEKYFDTSRGYRYRYYISSASDADTTKPLLVICHGWPDSAHLWQFILPHLLKSKNRILVPDMLGYGGTSKPTDPAAFEIKGMTEDMMQIIKGEHIDSFIIPMGHDFGAYFASRLYLLHSDRMAGLITLNVALWPPATAPFDLEASLRSEEERVGYPRQAYWELFADPEGPKVMDRNLESVWYAMHGDVDDWMQKLFCTRGAFREWVENGRTDVPLKPFAQDQKLKDEWINGMREGGLTSPGCWYRAMAEGHQLPAEKLLDAHVDAPYLFIGADGDAVCRTDAIETPKKMGLMKDYEVHELHSGHWTPLEKPDEIASIVLEWLKRKGLSGQ